MCNRNCDKFCPNFVFSDSVTIVTVDGTDTLVIDIPGAPSAYYNCRKICLAVTQAIPAAATLDMPVAISIGGVTTTVYPIVSCNCAQVTARQIDTRYKYKLKVFTNGTGGVFKVYNLPTHICPTVLPTLEA